MASLSYEAKVNENHEKEKKIIQNEAHGKIIILRTNNIKSDGPRFGPKDYPQNIRLFPEKQSTKALEKIKSKMKVFSPSSVKFIDNGNLYLDEKIGGGYYNDVFTFSVGDQPIEDYCIRLTKPEHSNYPKIINDEFNSNKNQTLQRAEKGLSLYAQSLCPHCESKLDTKFHEHRKEEFQSIIDTAPSQLEVIENEIKELLNKRVLVTWTAKYGYKGKITKIRAEDRKYMIHYDDDTFKWYRFCFDNTGTICKSNEIYAANNNDNQDIHIIKLIPADLDDVNLTNNENSNVEQDEHVTLHASFNFGK